MRLIKGVISLLFSRLFLVGLMITLQIALLVSLIAYASRMGLYAYLLFVLISAVVVIFIVSNPENPSYKITWIIAILIFPVTGGIFYLMLGNKRMPTRLADFARSAMEDTRAVMPSNTLAGRLEPQLVSQSNYIYNMSGYPTWQNQAAEFFPVGEIMFERMLEEIREAKRYVFLEYFIITPGYMFDTLLDLLAQKVKEGVEVRLMYDDVGSIRTLSKKGDRRICEAGIKRLIFNPFRPRISVILNYRDHRKLCIIDGTTVFCGGINIADEYINKIDRYGHWKDTGVLIKGPAVWGFTHMFLQQWAFEAEEPRNYDPYLPVLTALDEDDGLVQVFGDSPLDRVNVTETAYRNIISKAERYVYLTTPYLVIDYEMESALCAAAESGLDVRIITPHRYDKWYVHMLTRSHYSNLIRSGVRIFEYTPGFMHGKTFVSDDSVSMVGTCNMDFRSFYLHFECSASFYHTDTVLQVRDDFLSCQAMCQEITLEESLKIRMPHRILRALLKVFAPLF